MTILPILDYGDFIYMIASKTLSKFDVIYHFYSGLFNHPTLKSF